MKKTCLLLIMLCILLCGCGKVGKEDATKSFINKVNNAKSYKIKGKMEISNDEETFLYDIECLYLNSNYYRVSLINETSNNEQIILKNKEDVYVITPLLNKSFKFQSEWPNNSSQAYLPDILVKDIQDDNEKEVIENNDGYIIRTKVNYPNNPDLKYQKIYINDNNIEKVEVYNDNDIVKIKVVFDNISWNEKIKEDEFLLDNYVKEDNDSENKECNNEKEECNKEESKKTVNIDNIIYPLYIPSNTHLASSEKVDTGNGNRIILTFSGEKNFVLIEEVGALSANSLSWEANNISYYLASTELSTEEMKLIANSLGNETLVANTK